MTEFTMINGYPCNKWGMYKGYEIYRAFNVMKNRPMMKYFAVGVTEDGIITLEAGSLDRIKDRVSEEVKE